MTPDELKEHRFEADIERYLLTEGGYTKGTQATYDKEKDIDLDSLIRFIKDSQPKAWEKMERVFGAHAKAELYKTMQVGCSNVSLCLIKEFTGIGYSDP